MSQPIISILLSDSDSDDGNNKFDFTTPVSNHRKRPIPFSHPPDPINVEDDPTPPSKLQKSVSSTTSFVPETPLSELSKLADPPVIRCAANLPKPHSGSALNFSGDEGLICVESDDEAGGPENGTCLENTGACAGFDVENESERSLECIVKEKQLEHKDLVPNNDVESWLDMESNCFLHKGVESNVHVEGERGFVKRSSIEDEGSLVDSYSQNSEKRPKFVATENCVENERITVASHAEYLQNHPTVVQSACRPGNLTSKKTYDNTHLEDDFTTVQTVQDHDHDKENVRLEEGCAIQKPKLGGRANAEKKQKKEEQAANRKKLMEEKKLKKEQEKAETARLKQLEKEMKKLEKKTKKLEKYKFSEKDIVAEIDLKVLSGSLGETSQSQHNF